MVHSCVPVHINLTHLLFYFKIRPANLHAYANVHMHLRTTKALAQQYNKLYMPTNLNKTRTHKELFLNFDN